MCLMACVRDKVDQPQICTASNVLADLGSWSVSNMRYSQDLLIT